MAGKTDYILETENRYEDISTLKRYLQSLGLQHQQTVRTITVRPPVIATGGAGAAIEVEQTTGSAIAQIGKVEIEVKLSSDEDNAAHNGETFTMVYRNAAGTQVTAIATGTATLLTTAVAFAPAVTDFYCMESLVSSIAASAGKIFFVHTSGAEGTVWGTIAAETTTALEAAMFGVGSVYGRYSANDVLYASIATLGLDYFTPWGELKEGATCTIGADSSVEIVFIKADGTTHVRDYYRTRDFSTDVTPDSVGGEHAILCDADANPNGGGADVYGMIEQDNEHDIHTRFMTGRASDGYRTFLCGFKGARYSTTVEHCNLTVTFTPKDYPEKTYISPDIIGTDSSVATKDSEFISWLPCPIELEPVTEVTMTVADDAAAGGNFNLEEFIIIERRED